jgi:ABC-type Na+ efflux pump permease subunit
MRTYYLKPPNISWGLIFPLAWTGMFFIRSGGGMEDILSLVPGVVAISILFGTTSMLAITVTFEKKGRSFERLLLAPIPLELLMLAKTGGAILFGVANACVPVIMAAFLADLSMVAWEPFSISGGVGLPEQMNFVLTLFAYDTMAAMLIATFGEDGIIQSPFWFTAEGASIGLFIGYLATRFGGEGSETVAR